MRSDPTLTGGQVTASWMPKHAPMTAPMAQASDLRTVGELLVDADHHARTLLLDVEPDAAPGLLRSWADTVTAGAALWVAFPRPRAALTADATVLDRVAGVARSVEVDLATARWPGAGPGDHRLRAIADNLIRAGQLVDRYASDLPVHRSAVQRDLEAARTRLVHTLYLATHGVVVALNADGRQRAADPTRTEALQAAAPGRGRYQVGPGVRWAARLGVAERILGADLRRRDYAEALTHEHSAPVTGLARLRDALARFDILAHRALVNAPSAANQVLVTRTEGMFLAAALVLTHAAARTGHLDHGNVDPRHLEHTITVAGESWTALARRWRDLLPPGARFDPSLATAAGELRAACRELTHAHDQLADPATIACRVDLAAALRVVGGYIDAGTDLAEATKPPLRDPHLTAPARAVVRRLEQDIEDGLLPADSDALSSDLITRAARSNQHVPVPVQLIEALASTATRAGCASAAAANSISTGHQRGVSTERKEPGQRGLGVSRHEPRGLASAGQAATPRGAPGL